MQLSPRFVARLVSACACALIVPLLLSACGSESADSDGGGDDPVTSEELVTVQVDVDTEDPDTMAEVALVLQRRLAALGIERGDVGWDGSTIEVLVPDGDEELLRRALGAPASLEFRPVLAVLGEAPLGEDRAQAEARMAELRSLLEVPDGVTAAQIVADEQAAEAAAGGPGGNGSDEGGSDDGGEAATPALNQWGVDVYVPEFAELFQLEGRLQELTPPDQVAGADQVTLVGVDGTLYLLGPVVFDGTGVESAAADQALDGQWYVNPVLTADGVLAFNRAAAACYDGATACPALSGGRGQLAMVLDGEVLSAPSINQPSFERDQIQVSGDFDEIDAEVLAAALSAGAAPATWTVAN